MTDEEENPILEHFGVKGMRWGVRKEDDLVGRKKSSAKDEAQKGRVKTFEKESSRIQAELKKRGETENDNALLKAKYETPAGENPTKGLSRNQKIAIGVGVGVIGAVAVGYLAYKGGAFDKNSPLLTGLDEKFSAESLTKRFKDAPESAKLFTARLTADQSALSVDGLKINWDTNVSLSPGSVIKRVSSVAETQVRSSGFFGAFRDDDVKSYSAILPSYWAKWKVGVPMDGGFINHYKASEAIKAPSGRKTLDLFRTFIRENDDFRKAYSHLDFDFVDDDALGGFLKSFSMGWVNSENNQVASFFNLVRREGFNALIDFNDAGIYGKTPLRIIDSSIFSIVKNEALDFESMVKAAEAWSTSLVHIWRNDMADSVESVLSHFGVKGQKWGVRRTDAQLARARGGDSADFTESRQNKATPNRQLSNAQLKKLNERLQLEKTNKDLTSAGAVRKIQRGNAIANSILATGIVLNSAVAFVSSPVGQKILSSIKK